MFAENLNTFLLPLIASLGVLCAWYLFKDNAFNNRKFGWKKKATKRLFIVFGTFAAVVGISTLFTYYYSPQYLFYILSTDIQTWLILLIVYPLLSALPQEIIFRAFVFHRYKIILPNKQHRMLLSSVCFGFAHIFYANWIAVGLSMMAGYVFCLTYAKTKSTLLVSIEHSLWGLWMFTIGLGFFFDSAQL